jgi:drug/metabolite transporter (DMT)-like permease
MTETLKGVVAMVAAMFFFNVGDTVMKLLGDQLPLGQMMFVRGLMATAMVLLAAHVMGQLVHWRRALNGINFWRAVCEASCTYLFFVALFRIPFADAAAIGQFTPLVVMAGAALFLGEPVGWRRWSAAGVGFLGVLLIIKPGTGAFQPMALIMLASMLAVAGRDLLTRRMPSGVPTILLTATSAIAVLVTSPLLIPFERAWQPMSALQVVALFICAATVLLGYFAVIIAMRNGATGVVSPFRYSYMLFALLSSLIVFRERPDAWSWLGIGLIIGAGLYMVHRERIVGGRR